MNEGVFKKAIALETEMLTRTQTITIYILNPNEFFTIPVRGLEIPPKASGEAVKKAGKGQKNITKCDKTKKRKRKESYAIYI